MIDPTRLADSSDGETFVPIPSSEDSEKPGRLQPGQLFSERYRIEALVGRGGMGEVYQARDLRLHQTIALKLLHESASRDAQTLGLFIDEVRIARQITHPNVCRVFDLGEVDGTFFLTMESIDGDDLASVLKWAGPLPQQRAAEMALQICQGLDAVHQQGILHRDLKPSNLLFDLNGVIHITDFGLAGWIENDASQGGTPRYMAPELFAGGSASLQSDLYALGVSLYELLSGEHPYAGHPLGAVRGEPTRLSDYVAVDPSFERAILRCLDADPERRPSSVEVLINSLSPDIEGDRLRTVLYGVVAADGALRHEHVQQDLLDQHGGLEVRRENGFLMLFERPGAAARFALAYQTAMARLITSDPVDDAPEAPRLGIHLGEVSVQRKMDPNRGSLHLLQAEGQAVELAGQLARMADPRQILLTETAAGLARRGHESDASGNQRANIWMSHGDYRIQGSEAILEVFEVGRPGFAPLNPPSESPHGLRMEGEETILGWRPAPGLDIPYRDGWRLQRRVGEGGFGEVWLAQHLKTLQRHIFKFCYDRQRLYALKREITLVRLIGDTLGQRDDIASIIDWNLDQAPYFLETEYTAGGNLAEWAQRQGGLDAISLEQRRTLIVQVAEALSASHSVGVLHKDVKPENILITGSPGAPPRIRLTDFGVGIVTDRDLLGGHGLTELHLSSMTEMASSLSGATRLYAAPELLEGKAATAQADVYALGVLLYQMEVGDFSRALATGWEHDILDPLLRRDIADTVDGAPERRLASPRLLADRLRNLPRRRAEAQERALQADAMLRARRRQRWSVALTVVGFAAAILLWIHQNRLALEIARAEQEAATSEQIAQFLVDLFQTADPSVHLGEGVTARDLLDRGAERLDAELQGSTAIRARLAQVIGKSYYALGLYEPARQYLQRAVDERRGLEGANADLAESLAFLSQTHFDLGNYEAAEDLAREALDLLDGLTEPHQSLGFALLVLGDAVLARGDAVEAGDYYVAALEAQRRRFGQDHEHVANTLSALAGWHRDAGDPAEAERLFRQALAMSHRISSPESRLSAGILDNIGSLMLGQGRNEEAEGLFRETLRLHRQHLGNKHRDVAFALNNLALILEQRGQLDEAEEMFRESLDLKRQLFGDAHRTVATAFTNLAMIEHKRRRFDQAIHLLERGFSIVHQQDNHLYRGIIAGHLARSQIAQGNFQDAGSHLDQAFTDLGDHFDAEHWRMAQIDSLRGAWLMQAGQLKAAEPLLRRAVPILQQQKGEDSWYAVEAAARLAALEDALQAHRADGPELRAPQ